MKKIQKILCLLIIFSITILSPVSALAANCTTKDNHSIACGGIGRWFSSRDKLDTYFKNELSKWTELAVNNKITGEELFKYKPFGYECYSCSYCGKWTGNFHYRETIVDNGCSHNWNPDDIIVVPPTCTTEGTKTFTCLACKATSVETIPLVVHSYIYTPNGDNRSHTITCENCDYNEVESCEYTDTVVEPTCTSKGYTEHRCEKCGNTYQDEETPKLEHNFIYTPNNDGTHTITCENCDYKEIVDCDYKNTIVVEPTCTTDGYTKHECKDCGYITTDTPTDKIEHSYIYTPNGDNLTHTITCENCDYNEVESCEYTDTVVEPTCTSKGYTEHRCEKCGNTYQDEETPKLEHIFIYTSNKNGTHKITCENCDYKEIVDCDYKNTIVVEPTCTTEGYTMHQCSVCNYYYTDTPTDKIEHSYIYTPNGDNRSHTITCENCEYDEIKPCEYVDMGDYEECKYCGNVIEKEELPPSPPTKTTLGDVNDDGDINALDAILIDCYVSSDLLLTKDELERADVNDDGYVNTLDAILIQRYDSGQINSF